MKEKVLIFLGGAVLGIAAAKYRDFILKFKREGEDDDLHSKFMALEEKLKKDEEDLILKEGLKEGSAEYLKKLIELKENFITEGEKIAKRINGKVYYGYCYTMINLKRSSVSQLKEELKNIISSN